MRKASWGQSKQVAIRTPKRGLHWSLTLLAPWFQIPKLQIYKKINFCYFSHSVMSYCFGSSSRGRHHKKKVIKLYLVTIEYFSISAVSVSPTRLGFCYTFPERSPWGFFVFTLFLPPPHPPFSVRTILLKIWTWWCHPPPPPELHHLITIVFRIKYRCLSNIYRVLPVPDGCFLRHPHLSLLPSSWLVFQLYPNRIFSSYFYLIFNI